MENYIATKVVKARPMTRHSWNIFSENSSNGSPSDEGYLVEYEDCTMRWISKQTFELAYHKSGNLDFGDTNKMLKNGFKATRREWHKQNVFIYLVKETTIDKDNLRNEAYKHLHDCKTFGDDTGVVTINSHIDMKTEDGSILVGWTPSQTDMLAEDWVVLD